MVQISIRDASYSVLVSIICIGLVAQMLGPGITLGDLGGSEDNVGSALLIGFAVPSSAKYILFSCLITSLQSVSYAFQHEHMLSRPPPFTR
jgi:hypothetical protein